MHTTGELIKLDQISCNCRRSYDEEHANLLMHNFM